MRSPRPNLGVLLDWVEGRLDEARSREVADQVERAIAEGDRETQEALEWAREFLAASRVLPLAPVPDELGARLRMAFTDHLAPRHGGSHFDAVLEYDSRRVASGMRSVGAPSDAGIRLVFETELGTLVLDAMPGASGRVDLRGLLTIREPSPEGADVGLTCQGTLRRTGRCGRDGWLELAGVPDDVDELWITSGDVTVRAALDLRP